MVAMASALASTTGLNVPPLPTALEAAAASSTTPPTITAAVLPKTLLFNKNSSQPTLILCKASVDHQRNTQGVEGGGGSGGSGGGDGCALSTRRSMLNLLAASVAVTGAIAGTAKAAPTEIKVEGPPPPSGGLPGTENADQARDLDLPLKDRFFLQPLTPAEAVSRIKESAEDIVGVKDLIAKKAWPYVQNDLRSKASYLRFDLNTVISSKPTKEEKRSLKALTSKLFETIDKLDYAARSKSLPQAEKYYAETVSALNNVISKIA